MAVRRATESGALRALRSATPSTARPRAVDGACGFRPFRSQVNLLAGLSNLAIPLTPGGFLKAPTPYIEVQIVCYSANAAPIILKPGPAPRQSGRRSPLSTPLRQPAWVRASESQPAKPAAGLQCGRKP